MRQSFNSLDLITLEDGTAIGISLGHGRCGEHEDGIDPIVQYFDCHHPEVDGVDRFRARALEPESPTLALFERDKSTKTIAAESRLIFYTLASKVAELSEQKPRTADLPAMSVTDGKAENPLYASWDKRGFCIRAFGDAEREMVRKIHAAALAGDLVINMGGGSNPFDRASLCLTVRSLVPESFNQNLIEDHQGERRLQEAAEKTGIHKLLEAVGLKFYALAPHWATLKSVMRDNPDGDGRYSHTIETSHPVVFFLNPARQSEFNHGWFTVEELQQWAKGEGPILKA